MRLVVQFNASQRRCLAILRGLAVGVLTVAAAPSAFATPPPSTGATAPDRQSERLAAFRDALDQARREIGFPGATAAFVLSDGRSGVVAVGVEDKATNVPLSPEARMLSGSTGKTFTSAVALAFVQQGKLDLDAPISRYLGDLPWFAKLANGGAITTRQLLAHRSGLNDYVGLPAFLAASFDLAGKDPDRHLTPEECIAFVLEKPAQFQPGQGYAYTDTEYLLAGLIIEKVSGQRYYDLVRSLFLDPLGLALTSPSDRRSLPGLAQGEPDWDGAPLPPRTLIAPGVLSFNPGSEWTGGGFASNALDMARWAQALYSGKAMIGDYRLPLLDSKPLKARTDFPRYGLGVSVYQSPYGVAYGHSGYFPGYRSDLAYFKDSGIAVAFQIDTEFGVRDQKVLDRIRNALMATLVEN